MVLFILHKLILQTRMRSHPVGLDVRFLVRPFVYFHTSCVQTAKALVRLRECAGSPEPSLVACVISTIISWAGSFNKNDGTWNSYKGMWNFFTGNVDFWRRNKCLARFWRSSSHKGMLIYSHCCHCEVLTVSVYLFGCFINPDSMSWIQ